MKFEVLVDLRSSEVFEGERCGQEVGKVLKQLADKVCNLNEDDFDELLKTGNEIELYVGDDVQVGKAAVFKE